MKRILVLGAMAFCFFVSAPVYAERGRTTATFRVGMGADTQGRGAFLAALRVQNLQITPILLEAFMIAPYGVGVDLQVMGLTLPRFRLRFFDLGIFWGKEATNDWVPHSWSIMLGGGLEYDITFCIRGRQVSGWAFTFDYRAFLPDPSTVLPRYGDFGKEIYLSSLREGQWIFGLSVTW